MVGMKTIAESKCFEGTQWVLSHQSKYCACGMTFGIYIPEKVNSSKLPLIWFLSGLTCTHENAMVKSGSPMESANLLSSCACKLKMIAKNNSPKNRVAFFM